MIATNKSDMTPRVFHNTKLEFVCSMSCMSNS